jgi:DNA-binding NtrC family response regulator
MVDKWTILIVEDDAQWQSILKETLEDEGYDVTVIADYQYGRQALQKGDFDLVILDLELDKAAPTLEGKRLLNLVSRHHPGTPCIVVSGKGDTQTVRDAFKRYGVVDFITKERFDIPAFVNTIQTALAPNTSPTTLRRILDERFDLEEIKDLCFDLDIDFDNLPGSGKKAREVVAYCKRHSCVTELVTRIGQSRPGSL